MREIKFRAWCEGCMYSAVDIFHSHDGGIECVKIGFLKNPYNGKKSKAIENVNLMQYTGLKDKNGVEIFEGDIVYISGVGNLSVVFKLASWCFEDEYHLIQFSECEDIEGIVGNIYQSPELVNNQ